jgi:hypothetical protein
MEKEVLDDKKSGVLRKVLMILGTLAVMAIYVATLVLASLPVGGLPAPFGNSRMALVTMLGGVALWLFFELINWRFGLGPWHYLSRHSVALLVFMVMLAFAGMWHLFGMQQTPDTQIIFVWAPISVFIMAIAIFGLMRGGAIKNQVQRDEQIRSSP